MKWKTWIWPVMVMLLLGMTVAANGFMLYAANRGQSALEPDYYRKAVLWDSTMAQARLNQTLGWRLSATLAPGGELVAWLTDAAGAPMDGARVSVSGFAVAFEQGAFEASLAASGPGEYAAAVSLARPGLHELRFQVERGPDRFTTTLRGTPGMPLTAAP